MEACIRYNTDGESSRPELSYIDNVDTKKKLPPPRGDKRSQPGTERWHLDSSFKPVPAYASILTARIIPPTGGETKFADLRGAWNALPTDMQQRADGLVVEHDIIKSRQKCGDQNIDEDE